MDNQVIDLIDFKAHLPRVLLFILVENEGLSLVEVMRQLHLKIEAYSQFILTGQLAENPECKDRPVSIVVAASHAPPTEALTQFAKWQVSLETYDIRLEISAGTDLTHYLDLAPYR